MPLLLSLLEKMKTWRLWMIVDSLNMHNGSSTSRREVKVNVYPSLGWLCYLPG
jgi:hypothetical protein